MLAAMACRAGATSFEADGLRISDMRFSGVVGGATALPSDAPG
jgi:hypothetical protein